MMVFDSADAIGFCFGIFNLLRLASYFPQIVAVVRMVAARGRSRCPAGRSGSAQTPRRHSTHGVRVGDLTLASVSAFNAACCLLVFLIAAYKRPLCS